MHGPFQFPVEIDTNVTIPAKYTHFIRVTEPGLETFKERLMLHHGAAEIVDYDDLTVAFRSVAPALAQGIVADFMAAWVTLTQRRLTKLEYDCMQLMSGPHGSQYRVQFKAVGVFERSGTIYAHRRAFEGLHDRGLIHLQVIGDFEGRAEILRRPTMEEQRWVETQF